MKKEFLAGGITAGIHASALLLLFFSVAWHTQKSLPVEVQLWDVEPMPAVRHTVAPTIVAQAPPETPPPAQDKPPEIVLKKTPIKPLVPTPPPKAITPITPITPTPAVNNRADELKRLRDQSQTAKSTPTANSTAADSENAYQKKLGSELRAKVFFDDTLSSTANPQISIRITLNAAGQLTKVSTIKSSGIPVFDQAVLRGIERLNKFPADKDGTYPPEVILNYRMRP